MSASMFFAGSLIFSLLYLAAPEAWLIDPFRFRDQAPQVLSDSIFVFFLPWAAAVVGHMAAGRQKASVAPTPSSSLSARMKRPGRKAGIFPLAVFFTASTYIVGSILLLTDNIGSTDLHERVFIDKSSQYLLLAFGASAYASMSGRGAIPRTIIEAVLLSTCLLIANVDMSREALIPTAFALAFYLQHSQYRWRIVLWLCANLTLLLVVMIRRDFTLADAIQQQTDIMLAYLVEAVSYITAFNLFHFGQVVTDGVDTGFSWLYLMLSVVPLPSWVIGAEVLESRNFDAFRPYGASADMLSLSPFVLVAYWALFGWVARISTRKRGIMRVVLAALLFILFVTSFQYPLRTSSKFFILVLVLLGADRLLRRRGAKINSYRTSADLRVSMMVDTARSSNFNDQNTSKAF